MLPEAFSASSRIRIERDQSDISGVTGPQAMMMTPYDPYFIQTEFEVIQSEIILDRVIEQLNLNKAWAEKYGGGQPLKTTETRTQLKRSMDLRAVRNTSLIEIKVYSDDPKEASDIANAIANAYKLHRLENRRGRTEEGIKTIETRLADQEEQVRKAQKRVDDLRVELNVPDSYAAGGRAFHADERGNAAKNRGPAH